MSHIRTGGAALTALAIAAALSSAPVSATSNQPPVIEAGPDLRLTLPESSVCLDAITDDDGLPGPLTVSWAKLSGPAASLAAFSATASTATLSGTGTRVFEATADDGEFSVTDTTSITVGDVINVPGDAATIQAGIDMAVDGDTVLVAPGIWNESLEIDNKTITLASNYLLTGDPADRDATVIDGGGADWVVRFSSGVGPESAIVGFHIRNGVDGIYLFAPMNVLDNYVTDTHDAVEYKDDTGGLARGNILEFNLDDGFDINRRTAVVIEENIVRYNDGDGIENRMKEWSGPAILPSIYRNNLIHDNGDDGIQLINYDVYSPRSFLIEGNLIYDNGQAGIGIMGNGNTHESFEGFGAEEEIIVRNNVFSGNDHGITGGHEMTTTNNIFVGHTNIAMKNVDGNSFASHNLFWNNGTDIVSSNVDAGTTYYVDPLLDGDLHLTAGSPAIDAGADVGLPFAGSGPDLGANETPLNTRPVVDAGPDFTVEASVPVTLAASATDDGLPATPGTLTAGWDHVTGPCGVVFSDSTSPTSDVTFPVPGTYRLRLSADDGWATAADEAVVTVTPYVPPAVIPKGGVILEGDTGQSVVDVLVQLSKPHHEPVTIDWQTFDTAHPNVAKSGSDFLAASGTATFLPGETELHVPITVLGDTIDEPDLLWGEWGLIAFSNPSANATLDKFFFGLAVFIIVDDDP